VAYLDQIPIGDCTGGSRKHDLGGMIKLWVLTPVIVVSRL